MSYFKPRNFLLVLAVGLALVLLVVIVLRYRPEGQLQAVVKALPEGVDVSLEDIDYTHIEGGRARWRLIARHVERQSESKVMTVNNPQLSFFDTEGRSKGEMRAGKGKVSDDYKKVRLYNDVVLKNSSGYTLYTDRINYDHETQTATTDARVRLIAGNMVINGTGLVFYVPQERVLLQSDIKGSFKTD
jgi:LPS export ABC transporter protein LptC